MQAITQAAVGLAQIKTIVLPKSASTFYWSCALLVFSQWPSAADFVVSCFAGFQPMAKRSWLCGLVLCWFSANGQAQLALWSRALLVFSQWPSAAGFVVSCFAGFQPMAKRSWLCGLVLCWFSANGQAQLALWSRALLVFNQWPSAAGFVVSCFASFQPMTKRSWLFGLVLCWFSTNGQAQAGFFVLLAYHLLRAPFLEVVVCK